MPSGGAARRRPRRFLLFPGHLMAPGHVAECQGLPGRECRSVRGRPTGGRGSRRFSRAQKVCGRPCRWPSELDRGASMASPDEARVDEARDQSTVPASPSDPTPASGSAPVGDEPASAPQRRPRGAASFPGGPPPAAPAPAPADTPVVPPTPAPPPQFQVTTVKPAAASFPGGPPPPAPPPRDDPPAARARSETTTRPTRQPSEAEGARTSEDVPTGDPTASGEAAPTSEADR